MSRLEEELLLSCECHGYHYIEFWADKDFGLLVTHVERPRHWREKLHCIWKIIRGGEIFDGDLIVKKPDLKPLLDYLIKATDSIQASEQPNEPPTPAKASPLKSDGGQE
jgi:hypothetical protein